MMLPCVLSVWGYQRTVASRNSGQMDGASIDLRSPLMALANVESNCECWEAESPGPKDEAQESLPCWSCAVKST